MTSDELQKLWEDERNWGHGSWGCYFCKEDPRLIVPKHHLPGGSATGSNAAPQVGKSAGNSLQLTFTRYLDRTDLTQSVAGADSPTGPWTDLATSVGGAPFAATAPGATAVENGSGATRTVTVTDSFVVTDPLHRRRYLRLNVTR